MTTSLLGRIASAALLGGALAGCGTGLSRIDSRIGTDPIPPFDRMIVVSAASDNGNDANFPQMIAAAFRNAAARCGITADFVYERLDNQPVGPRHAAMSGMELSVVPNAVFDDASRSYKFSPSYGYIATLTDRSRKLELWKASFGIRHWAFMPRGDSGGLATAISDTLFARLAQDGVLRGCSSAGLHGDGTAH